jgi:hypothetical protein
VLSWRMGTFRNARTLAIWDSRISDLRDGGSVTVTCLCPSCRHEAIIPVETIKTVLGERIKRLVEHLPRFLRCTVCGDHRAEVDVGRALGRDGPRNLSAR